jgi:GT2 family glycosyltransferase
MFNSGATLQDCVGSIPEDCEIILVDQSSTDNSISVAVRTRPDARVIRAGANRGFAAGCNLGAANAHGEVLIFLNPDASFGSPESVQILADVVFSRNALVGPRIKDSWGNDQTRARYWSRAWSDIAEIFVPTALLVGALRRDIPKTNEVYAYGGQVPYIQGSCIAISAENFWRVGGFDERLYLYHEEETLARNLQIIGVNVILEPRAAITHIGGHSTSQFRDFAANQYYRSMAVSYILFRKRRVAIPTIISLWAALRTMAALTPFRKRIGLRSDKGRTWYLAASTGVLSGLRLRMVNPPAERGTPQGILGTEP